MIIKTLNKIMSVGLDKILVTSNIILVVEIETPWATKSPRKITFFPGMNIRWAKKEFLKSGEIEIKKSSWSM